MPNAYIEHSAYRTDRLDWYLDFFKAVFDMVPYRSRVEADGLRNVWLDGGVQLCEAAAPAENGKADHLCLLVEDLEAVREKMLARGCEAMPKHHWIRLPDGLIIEMVTEHPGIVRQLAALEKHPPKK